MNTNTIEEFEDGCTMCFGSGIACHPDGAEDFYRDFCDCPAGRALEEREVERTRKPEFQISNLRIYPWHILDSDLL
jgi:hypothetical protein